MTDDIGNEIANNWAVQMQDAGVENAELLAASSFPENFGNAVASFKIGRMIVRIVRDRDQDLVDVAFTPQFEKFYPIEDIEAAMGWADLDEIISRVQSEKISSIFTRLGDRLAQLSEKMDGAREYFIRGKFEKAAKRRQVATLASFQEDK